MAALTSLSSEEAELLTQIRYMTDRLDTVQKVMKTLSRLVQSEKVGVGAAELHS
jgi:hypothetical protein